MGQIMVSHAQGPQISFLNQSLAVSGEPRREMMYKMQGRDFHCGEEGRAANLLAVACLRLPVRELCEVPEKCSQAQPSTTAFVRVSLNH